MSEIKIIELKNSNWIQWLRYVRGYNLSVHCMESLLGKNDPRVTRFDRVMRYENLKLEKAPYYYFCCVQGRGSYDENVHLAWRDKEGSSFVVDNELIHAEILGAEQIPITDKYIDWSLPQSASKWFNTCRNWWFACWMRHQDKGGKNNGQHVQKTLFGGVSQGIE